MLSPVCVAVSEQLPVLSSAIVKGPLPLTVHTAVEFEVNVTARPLDAVGLTLIDPAASVCAAGVANVIVCDPTPIATSCVTCGAAKKFASPA